MATIVRDLIVAALKDSGAFGRGQVPPADAVTEGLRRLNWLLAEWNRKRWVVYRLMTLEKLSTGAMSYSVGPGGDFNCAERPDKIDSAFMRQQINGPNGPVDYSLGLILSREDYNLVKMKKLVTWTNALWYDPDYPLGMVYPVPVTPGGQYSLFISFKQVLTQYTSLEQQLGLPLEYEGAIHWNLVVEFADNYRIAPSGVAIGKAKDGLNTIRGSYTAVSALGMPRGLKRTGVRTYNIWSDRSNGNSN